MERCTEGHGRKVGKRDEGGRNGEKDLLSEVTMIENELLKRDSAIQTPPLADLHHPKAQEHNK